MGELIPMRPPGGSEYDGLTCECGSAWFTVKAICMSKTGQPTGYAAPVVCAECGKTRAE